MASPTTPIEAHPDIIALRMRYDQAAQRPTAQVVDGLSFLAGLFLALSPWICGFAGQTTLAANNFVTGGALTVLALGFAWAYGRTHGMAWVAPVIGVWSIIAPWAVAGSAATLPAVLSNVIVGALIVVLGLAGIGVGWRDAHR